MGFKPPASSGSGGLDGAWQHIVERFLKFNGNTAAITAGTLVLRESSAVAAALAGTGSAGNDIFRLNAADLPTGTQKLKLRAAWLGNASVTGNTVFTVELRPVTAAAGTSTGAIDLTLGASVASVSFTPASGDVTVAESSEFSPPTDGIYVLSPSTNATFPATAGLLGNVRVMGRAT